MGTVFVSREAEQSAVEKVIGSKTLARNPRLTHLLTYLCRRSAENGKGYLKEYDIATDVFHRPPEFNQTTDAIVRVEMHRLRKKLKEYYATEGINDRIEISLHAGRYAPEFIERVPQGEQELEASPVDYRVARVPAPPLQLPTGEPQGNRQQEKWWLRYVVALLFLLLISLVAAGFVWSRRGLRQAKLATNAKVSKQPELASTPIGLTGPVATGPELRILCGSSAGDWRDREGRTWTHDRYFSGGAIMHSGEHTVYRTRDAGLFAAARTGEFSYKIPLQAGVYELRLYFEDPVYHAGIDMEGGEGTRDFTVQLNGATVLRDFDVIADAGPDTADIKVFKDVRPEADGFLHLAFLKQVGEPLLNAVEILPGLPHRLRPIRIAAQDREFADRSGTTWAPDNFFLQGRCVSRFGKVRGQMDEQIYERERYGHFSYAIPVASDGLYTATLYFAESFWGPEAPGGGGQGSRVFDVYCNGRALLRNFDMYKEAGANRQIVRTFTHLKPNAQGTLLLSFVPVKNYANISAIEVEDESK